MNDSMTGIWCQVSGGRTGTHATWLKENGVRWVGTYHAAERKAIVLNKSMNHPHSVARFCYEPMSVR